MGQRDLQLIIARRNFGTGVALMSCGIALAVARCVLEATAARGV